MVKISKIRKRDRRIVKFEQKKITDAIHKALIAVEEKDEKLAKKLSDKVVKILEKKFVKEIPSVEDVQDIVVEVLRKEGYKKVAREYLAYRKKKAEIRRMQKAFGIEEEPKLTVNSLEVLKKRYLLKNEKEKIIETPAQMFRRVARAIAEADNKYGKDPKKSEEEFYTVMSKLEFIPNSPTLFNAGTGTDFGLSACYVLPIEDSLESIFTVIKNTALIEQTGGGVGFDFSKLRPKGDIVRSTQGVASGPVSFMRVFDVATDVIKQGGRRRGAMMGILRVDHPDILEFITAKNREGSLTNFNISVAVTDEFMKAIKENKEYDLINPRTGKSVKKLNARKVWSLIAENAWKTGDPGVVFIDEINRLNPTPQIGRIESTNPCVTSDIWIMTSEGTKQVKDLIGKRFIAIVNGGKKKSDGGFFSTGKKPVYKLKTKEGFEIRLTADHLILKIKKMTRHKMETEWIKIGDLKKEDKILLNNHRKLKGWEGKYTDGEGYLVGLLIGDGTLQKKEAILDSWGDSPGPINVRNVAYQIATNLPHRSDFTGWRPIKNENKYRMSLGYLKRLCLGFGLRQRLKFINNNIEKTSYQFCRGVLRGMFDTDGSVQGTHLKGVSIRLSQSNLDTLKAIQRMLLRLGIFSVIYQNRRKEGKQKLPDGKGGYKEYNIKAQHELVISNDNILLFSKKIGFDDLEKAEKLKNIIKNYKRKLNRERFVATIKEIVPDGVEEVFDVRIPGINSFDANGFIVHNCGEVCLLAYESCNLGSINLSKMIVNGKIDWNKLKKTVNIAVHFLDNVIDVNKFPLEGIKKITKANRKIGLGVMGFAELLIKLKIPYDSQRAVKLAERVMKFIFDEARKKSEELGEKRGSFPNFEKSIFYGKYKTMRNATVCSIAPTGSISIIAGCSSGIEPLFAISFMRNVLEGTRLFEVNPIFERIAKNRGFYSTKLLEKIAKSGSIQKIKGIPKDVKKIFKTALDIKPEWHVRMQATFQKRVDNSVSKTINLPNDATVRDVKKAFELAYRLKCKGITVYRYGSKPQQVLYVGEPHLTAEPEYSGGCPTPVCTA